MTEKTLDWLNQNRFRAYPFINDAGLIANGRRIPDCILLDCLVVDTRRGIGTPKLIFNKIDINNDRTVINFTYGGELFSYTLIDVGSSGSSDSSDAHESENIVRVTGRMVTGFPDQFVNFSLTLSSQAYIREHVDAGVWAFTGTVLPSKTVFVAASGVSGVKTNGSATVQAEGTAAGNVQLEDGYRTQPVIHNGKVLVKVGTHYGYDPCHYPRESSNKTPCEDLLLFFCGQNAINSGNILLSGGPGVTVSQGRLYTARQNIRDSYGNIGIEAGENIPCVEVVASSELIRLYRPSDEPESGSSGSDS